MLIFIFFAKVYVNLSVLLVYVICFDCYMSQKFLSPLACFFLPLHEALFSQLKLYNLGVFRTNYFW
jgi:hypothetical protein